MTGPGISRRNFIGGLSTPLLSTVSLSGDIPKQLEPPNETGYINLYKVPGNVDLSTISDIENNAEEPVGPTNGQNHIIRGEKIVIGIYDERDVLNVDQIADLLGPNGTHIHIRQENVAPSNQPYYWNILEKSHLISNSGQQRYYVIIDTSDLDGVGTRSGDQAPYGWYEIFFITAGGLDGETYTPTTVYDTTFADYYEEGEYPDDSNYYETFDWEYGDPEFSWNPNLSPTEGIYGSEEFVFTSEQHEPEVGQIEVDPSSPTTGQSVTVTASASDDYGEIQRYEWSVAESTYTGESIEHTFSDDGEYNLELRVETGYGATSSRLSTVQVQNQQPEPRLEILSSSPVAGTPVSFSAERSNDPDGTITTYEWSIDGQTYSGETIEHIFSEDREYTVELVVTDDDGATNSTTRDIIVETRPPTANIIIETQNRRVDEPVTFSASESEDPDGSISSFVWDIGDEQLNGETVTHTFENSGEYTVRLTVTDNDGATDSTTSVILIDGTSRTTTEPRPTKTTHQQTTTDTTTADDDSIPWLPLGAGGVLASLAGVAAWSRFNGDDDTDSGATSHSPSGSDASGPPPSSTPDRDATSAATDPEPTTPDDHDSTELTSKPDQPSPATATENAPETIPRAPSLSLSYDDFADKTPIGKGGNADVYRVTITTSDGETTIAVKEPRMQGTLHLDDVDRLMEEAETWDQLDGHDHVVVLIDYGSEPMPWLAMEYMDAGHVGDRAGDLPLDQALWTAIAITKAVRHAHRRGVAHLDLKPENVLFRSVEGRWDVPKVTDWGLSKHLLRHSKSVEGMSPHYAAPEQFKESYGPVDDVTDVYQLGAVLYELFTGRPVFEGEPVRVMNKVLNETPQPPSEVADVPDTLDDILLRALAKEKSERYESVLYLRDELQDIFHSA